MNNLDASRISHFADHWMAWVALRHFLPANLQWELLDAAISAMSEGRSRIDDMYDRLTQEGPELLKGWIAFPKGNFDSNEAQLAHVVRAFAWQSDSSVVHVNEVTNDGDKAKIAFSKMWELSTLDLSSPRVSIERCQVESQSSAASILKALLAAYDLVRATPTTSGFINGVLSCLSDTPTPLRLVAIKHIGDLCADLDEWNMAYAAYRYLEENSGLSSEWSSFYENFGASVSQSVASAKRVISGPSEASEHLKNGIDNTDLPYRTLLETNGSLDQLNFEIDASEDFSAFGKDSRPSVLQSPQLHDSLSLEAALKASLEGKSTYDVMRQFWRILRRQVALGLYTQVKDSRAHMGLYLLNCMSKGNDSSLGLADFILGVRLLMQGAGHKLVDRIAWTDTLVAQYVTTEVVNLVVQAVVRHPGDEPRRKKVAIQLFSNWLQARPTDKSAAQRMLSFLVEAASSAASFFSPKDFASQALEELFNAIKKHPELKGPLSGLILPVLQLQLREGRPWPVFKDSLRLARECIDSLSPDRVSALLDEVLSFLNRMSPASNNWLVVQPALRILISPPVKAMLKNDSERSRVVLDTILRFGNEQETENANLLFYLHDFSADLLSDPDIVKKIAPAVAAVRSQLGRLRSTGTDSNITALLVAPAAAGRDGVEAALNALCQVLETAQSSRPSIALPYVYQSVLTTSNRFSEISQALRIDEKDLFPFALRICKAIIGLWKKARIDPLIFTTFSIPEKTVPDRIVIYNWTIATLRYCDVFEAKIPTDEIRGELGEACKVAALADSISLATSDFIYADNGTSRSGTLNFSGGDAFYRAVSRSVFHGRNLPIRESVDHFRGLVRQCLDFGPNALDALVFVCANDRGVKIGSEENSVKIYGNRLKHDADARRTVGPFFDALLE